MLTFLLDFYKKTDWRYFVFAWIGSCICFGITWLFKPAIPLHDLLSATAAATALTFWYSLLSYYKYPNHITDWSMLMIRPQSYTLTIGEVEDKTLTILSFEGSHYIDYKGVLLMITYLTCLSNSDKAYNLYRKIDKLGEIKKDEK
ncbi:MAG: hypothetical protein RLZZ292_2290 [Bacteroidota bacterium]|jgi:hypothetical protein